jgi:predicted hydrocarbon binding protein
MIELFDRWHGELIPKSDLLKDLSTITSYVDKFDEETGKILNGEENSYGFYFEQLENFAEVYPNFLCSSLPDKQGKILQYFYSLDYKGACKAAEERLLRSRQRY